MKKLSSSFELSKTKSLAIFLLISSWPTFKHVTVDDSQILISKLLWLMKEFGLNWNRLWLLFNVVYWFLFKPEFISGAPTISHKEIWTLRRLVPIDKVVTKHAQLHELLTLKQRKWHSGNCTVVIKFYVAGVNATTSTCQQIKRILVTELIRTVILTIVTK